MPICYGLLSLFAGIAVTLLDASNELGLLSFDDFQIIIGELAPFFLRLALELRPVSFDLIPVHLNLPVIESRMSPSNQVHGFHLMEVSGTIQVVVLGSYLKPRAMRSASFVV